MPIDFDKVKARRIKLGLTQQQAADAAGFESRQAWNNLERGVVADPRLSTIEKLARVLKLKARDIIK